MRATMTPPRSASTSKAKNRVARRKRRSAARWRRPCSSTDRRALTSLMATWVIGVSSCRYGWAATTKRPLHLGFVFGAARSVDRLAAGVLDVLLPAGLHQVDHLVGNRHVVEFLRHLVAVGIGPIEELQRRLHGFRIIRLLVDDDEAAAGDRPALGPRLVRQNHVEAR